MNGPSTHIEPVVPELTSAQQRLLLDVAEEAIRARLEGRHPDYAGFGSLSGVLGRRRATFVSLHDEHGALLGCIGSLAPTRPLVQDVAENAVAAAFADPRLPALTAAQFATAELEVSVLSELVPLDVSSVADLEQALHPGVDGLLVTAGRHRATFLPAVWRQARSAREFLGMLWQKAGMRPGDWPAGTRIERYRTLEFADPGPRRPIGS